MKTSEVMQTGQRDVIMEMSTDRVDIRNKDIKAKERNTIHMMTEIKGSTVLIKVIHRNTTKVLAVKNEAHLAKGANMREVTTVKDVNIATKINPIKEVEARRKDINGITIHTRMKIIGTKIKDENINSLK